MLTICRQEQKFLDLQRKTLININFTMEMNNQLTNIFDAHAHYDDKWFDGDTYDLLGKYKPNALIHCFSGSVELMREAVKMDMYISLGGVVTFV